MPEPTAEQMLLGMQVHGAGWGARGTAPRGISVSLYPCMNRILGVKHEWKGVWGCINPSRTRGVTCAPELWVMPPGPPLHTEAPAGQTLPL